MKRIATLCQLILLFFMSIEAQNFNNGIDFNLPWNDTLNSQFFPQFKSGPINETDYVSIDELGNFIVNDKPYRFFGANLTTRGAFPSIENAPIIAARMQKYGINLLRFHHIDNPWSDGSLFHEINGTRQFNQDRLNRLDHFLYQLKKHGIYVNMNLNVSRTFELSDGVIDADSLQKYGKGITQFDPYMIKLQKEYANMLLNHTNPYTGTTLSNDPVLAMVEIINENSLFRLWYGNQLQSITKGGYLPEYYKEMLDSLWIDFLIEKYADTEQLKNSWNSGQIIGDTLIFDGYENGIGENWSVELRETAAATAEITADAASGNAAAHIEVTSISSAGWHTKFKYTGASVKKDSIYEFYFRAKSDSPINISVVFQKSTSPWTYYQGTNIFIDDQYREYKVTYRAQETNPENLFIAFTFNNQTGNFYFDDFLFKTQSISGLDEDESLEEKNVLQLGIADILSVSEQRAMDQTEFYTKIQLNFLDNMKSYLKDSLNVRAPITGSNWFTGPENVYVQKEMDYIDNHAYWDHPHFPNISWDQSDWNIKNVPMLTAESGTIESLFNGLMVKNKPYTVSEYNHAYPNQFQSELFPLITSYLSYNDADGLMIFTYNSEWNLAPDFINSYFDINRNTSLMGSFPIFSYAFRNYLIDSSSSVQTIAYSDNDILRMPFYAVNSYTTHFPFSNALAYTNRLEMTFDNPDDFNFQDLPSPASGPFVLNNGQISWDKQGLLKINTEKLSSICGYLENYPGASTDMMELKSGSAFGAVNWLSLSDSALNESSISILNIGTKVINTGMIWDGTTTVHNNWGKSPSLVFPLQLELKLKTDFPFLSVCRLDEYGQIDSTVMYILAADVNGYVEVEIDQEEDKTIWYGIRGLHLDSTSIDTTTIDTTIVDTTMIDTTGIGYSLSSNILNPYPNPANQFITFDAGQDFYDYQLIIFDLRGKAIFRKRTLKKQEIDVSSWENGPYLFKIISKNSVYSGRLLVMH